MALQSSILIFITLLLLPARAWADEVFVYLRNGSLIQLQVADPHFRWTAIDAPENTEPEKLRWQDVRELRLTDSHVDEQIRSVNRWLQNLQHSEYAVREKAEQELSNPEFTAAFKNLIRKFGEDAEDDETRYRVGRILAEISDGSEEFGARFDRLIMKDDSVRFGNVLDFQLVGVAFAKAVKFGRKDIQNIIQSPTIENFPTGPNVVKVSAFNQIADENFYDEDVHIVESFEIDRFANPMTRGGNVGHLFHHQGLLMETEQPGDMVVIGYGFKYCPIDVGKHCVCPFDEASLSRLRGITNIRFCIPDQPDVAAGVKEFGIFLEKIEHSRDIVVEAYNCHGQMIGMVEATDEICVFAGFKSNQLITQIRILRNPDLPELSRDIDETYAFDALSFSKPEAIAELTRLRANARPFLAKVNLVGGQSLLVDHCQLTNKEIAFANPVSGTPMFLDWKDIQSIAFPYLGVDWTKPNFGVGNDQTMMVQLKDGSIVRTERDEFRSAFDFIGEQFPVDRIVGVWHSTARFPMASDLESGNPVLVYPSCRIVTDGFGWEGNSFGWKKSTSQKIVQNVIKMDDDELRREEEKDPDLTPDVDSVRFSRKGEPIPSLWLKPPVAIDTRRPHVRLFDGQYFVLGEPDGFRWVALDPEKKSIEIAIGGNSKKYPLSRVASIALPKATPEQ